MAQANKVLRILSVNKQDEDNVKALNQLEALSFPLICERVSCREEFVKQIELQKWDIVLFFANKNELSALESLIQIKKRQADLPFILISNGAGEEEIADLMRAGAEDVVVNFYSPRLPQIIKRIIRQRDIKEQKVTATNAAREAQESRDHTLAIVSHDIKNPLSVIQLEAQMLLKLAQTHIRSPLASSVYTQASRIIKTTDRVKALISDLLDKNKGATTLASLTKRKCEISQIFQEVVEANRSLILQKNISVRTMFPEEVLLLVDQNKIYQVLSNLFGNAIKFSPIGGIIILEIEETENDFVLSVSDSGPGLKLVELNMVFEKYWTGGMEGCSETGLGLYICKTIVEAHGGEIKVHNLPVSGAKFFFTIPKIFRALQVSLIKDSQKKILIIDDDEDLREVINWALCKEGFAVHSYADPREALEGLKSGRHSPLLIVLDNQMDSMQGSEFLKFKIESQLPEVRDCPVMMISASPEELTQSVSSCYNEVMQKPLDLEALIFNIKKHVVKA